MDCSLNVDATRICKLHIVIDYRKLNKKKIKDKYSLYLITDFLGKLGRYQYFTTLYLSSEFHQRKLCKKDIPKTKFNTENGHCEFLAIKTHLLILTTHNG